MKLHHLELSGLGPFRDTIAIDFDALGQSGLFLLEGATGSGKSTIIDAIVFALYGSVAGASAGRDRMRSHFTPPDRESWADLFFETPNGLFRIRRTPAFDRPKKRGTGTVRQNTTVKLWRFTSEDAMRAAISGSERADQVEPIASRVDEVGAEINRIIGLTHDQFTQTVVLPQGEFARFLHADTRDRQQVLERVFGTQFFTRVEEQFALMRKRAEADVRGSISVLNAAFHRLLEAAAVPESDRGELAGQVSSMSPPAIQASQQTATELAAEAERAAADAEKQLATAVEAARAAEEARDAALAHRSLVTERISAEQIRTQLAESAHAAQQAAARLDAHDRAERAFYALQDVERLSPRAAAAEQKLPQALHGQHTAWASAAADQRALAETATKDADDLSAAVLLEQQLPERIRDHAAAAAAVEELTGAARKAEQRVASRPEERAALVARRDALGETASQVSGLRAAVVAAQQILSAATHAEQAQMKRDELQPIADQHARDAKRAHDTVAQLRAQRLSAIATELAADLTDGEPCPVCGGVEHPAPARSTSEPITPERIEAAEQAQQRADTALSDTLTRCVALDAEITAARENAGGLSAEEAAERVSVAETAAVTAEQAQHELTEASRALETFDTATAELTTAASDARAALTTAKNRHTDLADAIEKDRATVAEAAGDHESAAERQRQHREAAAAATTLATALEAAIRAHDEWRDAVAAAETARREAGLPTAEAVAAARLTAEQRRADQELLTKRAAQQARVDDAFAKPEVKELTISDSSVEEAAAAVTAANASLTTARERQAEAQRTESVASARASRTREARDAFTQQAEQHEQSSATAQQILHLANIATGTSSDTARLTLSTYVVVKRFEAVVDAANARLQTLSGTLELELGEPVAGGSKKIGLDLTVIDRRSDRSRAPATLSGGETFFVSLALALGLADIVTAESGGVQLSTLFIDEGFGSLDPERLDSVIAEIRHLASTGRTVGIVSHVTELKQQIPEKIHVARRADGTSTITTTV